eukprot:3906141-Karenia_brevis.AAC.1
MELKRSGLCFYSLTRRAAAGCFFVHKKNGALRLIVDGRPGNKCLHTPPNVHLATAGSFSELRVPDGEKLFVASWDVETAFYNFRLPEWLGEYYGLEPVRASDVGIASLHGSPLSPDAI